jgi:hypothetical protein
MLEAFGFAEEWVCWIYGIISSVFFSILINGSPSKTFNPMQGIRQGDPLSPYLYIILVEGLGRLLQKEVTEKKIQGIRLQEEVDPVTHLQFFDDNLLMGVPTVKEARAIRCVLDIYKEASGTIINLSKSQFFFFNTPIHVQRNIARILGFQRASLPSKYLGAPLIDKAIWNTSWQELLEKLETKLINWTHRFLTLPGRILLIKSVLSSMPLYLFSVLAAPKGILKKLRTLQRTFLWGGATKEKKWALIAWEKLCKPKSYGGVGIKDPLHAGCALAAKLWWRWITNPEDFWAKVWKNKYAPEVELQDLIRMDGNRPGSLIWNTA